MDTTQYSRWLTAKASTWPGRTDPHVTAAHALLERIEPSLCPPLDSITVAPLDGNLYAACRNGAITTAPGTPFYRAAEGGDYWPLCALLTHENCHRLRGGDEREAYATELRFLARHRPEDTALYADVTACAAAGITNVQEEPMDYIAPDSYAPALARVRAEEATPATLFADRYRAERRAALDAEPRHDYRPPAPRTPSAVAAPDGYALAFAAMRQR